MRELSLTFVDDSESDHDLIQEALADLDVPVRSQHFLHAAHFLDSLARGEVTQDAVITDLNMPGPTGFDVIRALRTQAEWQDLPILVLTTSDSPKDRERASRLDIDGYFVKPVAHAALVAHLDAMVGLIRRGRVAPPLLSTTPEG